MGAGRAAGYGTRLGSAYGRSVVSRTVAVGVATADREDSRLQPSNETGVWRRTKHAVVGTFVSRTPSGGQMPAISRFVGVYSAAFIANAWEPPSQDSSNKAWERGSSALASSVGWHVFEEFWPIFGTLFISVINNDADVGFQSEQNKPIIARTLLSIFSPFHCVQCFVSPSPNVRPQR